MKPSRSAQENSFLSLPSSGENASGPQTCLIRHLFPWKIHPIPFHRARKTISLSAPVNHPLTYPQNDIPTVRSRLIAGTASARITGGLGNARTRPALNQAGARRSRAAHRNSRFLHQVLGRSTLIKSKNVQIFQPHCAPAAAPGRSRISDVIRQAESPCQWTHGTHLFRGYAMGVYS